MRATKIQLTGKPVQVLGEPVILQASLDNVGPVFYGDKDEQPCELLQKHVSPILKQPIYVNGCIGNSVVVLEPEAN